MEFKYNIISGLCASFGGLLTKIGFSFGEDGTISLLIIP